MGNSSKRFLIKLVTITAKKMSHSDFKYSFVHARSRTSRKIAGLMSGLSLALIPGFMLNALPAIAQASPATSPTPASAPSPATPEPNPLPPTARYANGEGIELADIITEWRGYYADVPVYLCICQDDTCDQTSQWPYREYDRYQFSVALGPTNGKITEAAGSNCFDIADGSRPSNPRSFSAAQTGGTPAAPATPPASPPPSFSPSPVIPPPTSSPTASATTASVPMVTAINNGADIRLDWPSGSSNVINVTNSNWNINVLNALDCESLSVVEEKMMTAQRVVGEPAVDQNTGYVAVPVLLDTCIEVDQSAVFVLDPTEGGGYALYRTQLPSVQGPLRSENPGFPNEFSSYAYSTIMGLRYWDSALLVRQSTASGAAVISLFRPGRTPAGMYAGCGIVSEGEGVTALCDE